MVRVHFYQWLKKHNSADTPFSLCLVIGPDHSFLDNFFEKYNNQSVLVYSTCDDFTALEARIIALWEKYPLVELSTKAVPFSFSHLELAQVLAVASDASEEAFTTFVDKHCCPLGEAPPPAKKGYR